MRDSGKMPAGRRADEELSDLAARRDALRQAMGLPGADPRTLAGAMLTELDGAIDALAAAAPADGSGQDLSPDGQPDSGRAERRLLHATFQRTPVGLFLLELSGTIRRANDRAAAMLGFPSGYATGKPLISFVDPAFRAAVQTQLTAVTRTGAEQAAGCRILTADGALEVTLTMTALDLPGDPPLLMVSAGPVAAAASPDAGFGTGAGGLPEANGRLARTPADGIVAAVDPSLTSMTKRLDMVTAVTRLLLDNSTFSEAVTLQRSARLLAADDLADWVIIDIDRDGQLRRQVAAGSRDGQSDQLARLARNADPDPQSVPWQVHATGKSVLLAHPDDPTVLGLTPDGTPLLMALGASSLICVPISEQSNGYGTLTMARRAGNGHFGVADLGLAEELGQHLAIAIRVDRMFRQRSEVAEALQASLLPATPLPAPPGLEFASAYIPATQWQEISGDFYDVFPAGDDWAMVIGDVCGKGQDAAAMTAAGRHSIRALAHVHDSPASVLTAANEVLVTGEYGERFVTAALAFLRRHGSRVQVRLGGCGHPGPALVRADGRVEILEINGLPLGLFDEGQAGQLDLELRLGDLLFFYTDGVTEARGADLSFFEDRLADALASVAGRSAIEVVRTVQELVTTFSRGELRDDVTILAVRMTA